MTLTMNRTGKLKFARPQNRNKLMISLKIRQTVHLSESRGGSVCRHQSLAY